MHLADRGLADFCMDPAQVRKYYPDMLECLTLDTDRVTTATEAEIAPGGTQAQKSEMAG